MLSGNEPLAEPILTQICHHMLSLNHNGLICRLHHWGSTVREWRVQRPTARPSGQSLLLWPQVRFLAGTGAIGLCSELSSDAGYQEASLCVRRGLLHRRRYIWGCLGMSSFTCITDLMTYSVRLDQKNKKCSFSAIIIWIQELTHCDPVMTIQWVIQWIPFLKGQ